MSRKRWVVMRWVWIMMPLLAMSWWSAPDWPARAQSLDEPWREPVWRAAVTWQETVRPKSIRPQPPAQLSMARSSSALVVVEDYPELHPEGTSGLATPSDPVPSPAEPYAISPGRVLTLGDSLMAEVALGLHAALPSSEGWEVIDVSRHSTGLSNQAYFDWPAQAAALVAEQQPVLVVIHLGGNDGQSILHEEKTWLKFKSLEWQSVYLQRAQAMIEAIQQQPNAPVIVWLGLPWMRDSGFEGKMAVIDAQQRLASSDIVFVDNRLPNTSYEKDGIDAQGKHRVWRADDGIHYTRAGGRLLAEAILSHPQLAPRMAHTAP